jgi:hypothetical protein
VTVALVFGGGAAPDWRLLSDSLHAMVDLLHTAPLAADVAAAAAGAAAGGCRGELQLLPRAGDGRAVCLDAAVSALP